MLDAGDRLLVYNSAKNNFWKVNSNVFEFIKEFNGALESLNDEENEIASLLHKLSIITTEEEDLNIAESFRLKFLTSSFSKENFGFDNCTNVIMQFALSILFRGEQAHCNNGSKNR